MCFVCSFIVVMMSLTIPVSQGWGNVGHSAIANVAYRTLSPHTRQAVLLILRAAEEHQSESDKEKEDGAAVFEAAATWADAVKHTSKYLFSGPLHYANPDDDEPSRCELVGKGGSSFCPDETSPCLLGALKNYTNRLTLPSAAAKDAAEAAKFVMHFVGDLHQPLHMSGRQMGGNAAEAAFATSSSPSSAARPRHLNLHTVWDTAVIDRALHEEFGNNYSAFVERLLSSRFFSEHENSEILPTTNNGGIYDMSSAYFRWARESNALNCLVVWPVYDQTRGRLNERPDYYVSAIRAMERQLVFAGRRLASVLEYSFLQRGRIYSHD